MTHRLSARSLALASIGVAGAAMLLTAGLIAALYAGVDRIPIRNRLLGGLFTWSWMAAPYFIIVAAARYLAPWRRRSVVLLAATVIATAFAALEMSLCLLHPTSTAPLALLVIEVDPIV